MRITKMSGNNGEAMRKTIDRQKWKRYSESKRWKDSDIQWSMQFTGKQI